MHSSGRDEEQLHLLWTSYVSAGQQERDKTVLETLELFHKIMFTTLKCQKAAFLFP